MRNNLRVYHIVLEQLCQWFPQERITRTRNMALFITGLALSTAVHLPKIVRKWPVLGQLPSLVNRLRRFLDNPRVDVRTWYKPVAAQLLQPFGEQRLRLVVDCTKVGFNFRLLTIGLAYRKRTLPLAWSVHRGPKGHVQVAEQIALFAHVHKLLPQNGEVWVMGDAGFQTVPLLRWFRRQSWHFVIRQQGKNLIYHAEYGWVKLSALELSEGQTRFLGWIRLTRKYDAGWFWLILHWEKGEDEPWYLVSDRAGRGELIRLYKVRMWVEEMYGDMKGHGFDLESTHLDNVDRIARLVLGVCLVFVWFIALGSWIVKRGQRHLLDRRDRRDKSYFRLGWDWLEQRMRLGEPVQLRFVCYP